MKSTFVIALEGMALSLSPCGWSCRAEEVPFTWGGRPVHPAVVNPASGQDAANVISLRGEWTFTAEARKRPVRNGIWEKMYSRPWKEARTIQVPSCWEAQGVGDVGESECWDATWDNNAKTIRHKYMGEGWYRKDVAIPAAWKGKRVWLKVGGVKSVAWIWVNERQVALVDNYCGTEKYEITDLVEPGRTARVVFDVDNTKPSRKGLMSGAHRWGGIYRDVELEATPQAFIDDAWVRGLFDGKSAEVHVELAGLEEARPNRLLRCTVEGQTVSAAARPGENVLRLPLASFRPWSPEHPNLYWATVELVEDGAVVHSRRERFGVRKFEVRGKEFYLNGKPFFVRGFGDDAVYPMTGLSPADRDAHRAHLAKARAAGFNFARLHTHCELPEYFEAADELGVMLQPELPYYSDVPTEGFAFDPKRDVTELWRNYRRHPSFAVYSNGNEGSFGDALDCALHRYVKSIDPDRLKINQDVQQPALSTPDRSDYVGGSPRVWPRGSFDPDRPFVTHEYLNLCVKSDARAEGDYTGVWVPPTTRATRRAWLAKFGLDAAWGDRLQDAQHVLQAVWQKRGVEAARADPFCDGYNFWTIVDVVVWNPKTECYTAQGLLDPLWREKRGGSTLAAFAKFNSPSCVLVDFTPGSSVFAAGDALTADVLLAHYGEAALSGASVRWRIVAKDGRTLAGGAQPVADQALGPARKIATAAVTVPEVDVPARVTFEVAVAGREGAASRETRICNDWPLWIFPKRRVPDGRRVWVEDSLRGRLEGRFANLLPADRAAEAAVVIAPRASGAAKEARARGQNLITVDGTDGEPNVKLGWWWMGPQVGTAILPHPALGAFPHEGALTPLLFRILKKGRELPAAEVRPEDMIIVGEGGEKCFLYLGERRTDASTVIQCEGIDVLSETPEGMFLLDAFVARCLK